MSMHKEGKAVAISSPVGTTIYATNCVPMQVEIRFPPEFTLEDRIRAIEGLRALYDEVTDRELKREGVAT